MNIANDLRAASGPEATTPTKENETSDSITVVPVSVNPVAASAVPCSTDVDEVSVNASLLLGRESREKTTATVYKSMQCKTFFGQKICNRLVAREIE